MEKFFNDVKDNVAFLLEFLGIIALLFVIAYVLEKIAQKKRGVKEPIINTRKLAMIGMFAALARILMLIEIPLPFAPTFYKLDFSEIPILVGSFSLGPAAGVLMEFVKILLKLPSTQTAFVGELANFAVGCSFIIPASVVYAFKKSKKFAIIGCVTGTLVMTIFGTAFNAIYLLPAFSELYGLSMDVLLSMGSEVNSLVKEGDIISFVVACVAPLNLIKGSIVSIVTMYVYKPLSPIIKKGINQ